MADVQLNVWIEKQYKDQLERWKQEDKKPGMNVIIEELIKAEIARRSGTIIEQQSLPAIREIVRAEVREATAQLRREVRLDWEFEHTTQRDNLRKSVDRLAGLMIHAIRNASMAKRLAFTILAKTTTSDFARRTVEDANQKIEEELLPRNKQKAELE